MSAVSNTVKHLLNGERFNRHTMPPDTGAPNDSLHSIISDIRNKRLIPVQSEWVNHNGRRCCDYRMLPGDVADYHHNREAQQQTMRERRAAAASQRLLKRDEAARSACAAAELGRKQREGAL